MSIYKISDLIEELKKQDCYKKFIKDNKDAFLCAGFFVLNLEEGEEKFQLDLFIPSKKKIAISELPFKEIKIQKDRIESIMPLEISTIQVDLPDLEEIIEKAKEENENPQDTTKIIAVLKDGIWNLTCMSSALDLIRINVSASNGQVLKFEKVSLIEFVRVERGIDKKPDKKK